ncbi:hypothetical protein P9112_009627 [Eukaryota sp. TZLM1-RC]
MFSQHRRLTHMSEPSCDQEETPTLCNPWLGQDYVGYLSKASPTNEVLINREVGIKSISSSYGHILLLTYSHEVYGWGCNDRCQVLYQGPKTIKLPIKLPFCDIVSISAGRSHSLALSAEGRLYGWGCNEFSQINKDNSLILPITNLKFPHNIQSELGVENFRKVFTHSDFSFAITSEGQVLYWGHYREAQIIKPLKNVVSFYSCSNSVLVLTECHQIFMIVIKFSGPEVSRVDFTVLNHCENIFKQSIIFDGSSVISPDNHGYLRKSQIIFNKRPYLTSSIKMQGLSNIKSAFGGFNIQAAIGYDNKVFVWGNLNTISNLYGEGTFPVCVEALTDIEGISVGHEFLFAYNKNTVLAWGRNDKGQLGTGDLIDRPQPVKVFGSELLGTFQHSKQPLDRMFSGLIKLVFSNYINFLNEILDHHPYAKARFICKSFISKRLSQLASEVSESTISRKILTDPIANELSYSVSKMSLYLQHDETTINFSNNAVTDLNFKCFDLLRHFEVLSSVPDIESLSITGFSGSSMVYNHLRLTHLVNLKVLELDYHVNSLPLLPTSLVKLVLKQEIPSICDLGYLNSLQILEVYDHYLSSGMLSGQIKLPKSLIYLKSISSNASSISITLPYLKELVFLSDVPREICQTNFPNVRIVKIFEFNRFHSSNSILSSQLCPDILKQSGKIKSITLVNPVTILINLNCFPWWIQFPSKYFPEDCLDQESTVEEPDCCSFFDLLS